MRKIKKHYLRCSFNQTNYLYYPMYYRDDQWLVHIEIHFSKFDHKILSFSYLQLSGKDHDK
jgi:hypothetical protein